MIILELFENSLTFQWRYKLNTTLKSKEFQRLLTQVPGLFRERNPDRIIKWLVESQRLSNVLTNNNVLSSLLINYIAMVQQLYNTWLEVFREGGILIESEEELMHG